MVRELGGKVTRDLHIINAVVATLPAAGARELAARPDVRAVTLNGAIKPQAMGDNLATSFNQSIQAQGHVERYRGTGRGVGVAVIDTGIAGDLADFRVSSSDGRSRVIGSAVVNPDATTATDRYGHGTHVAGIIAGDSDSRATGDPLKGRYSGVAPDANLISIKASDDEGNATVLDVIAGVQFAVDHKAEYNIRVLNLSLESTVAQSYKTDPLNAAVEEAWFKGIFVVAAAGNRGTGGDAVKYAPGNDPYVVTVGATDDQGTDDLADDAARELVQPRHDPGRRRQARRLRAGRPDRLQPRAEQRLRRPLRLLPAGERRVHPHRWHVDGRSDGGRRRRDRVPARSEPDPEPDQGPAARLRSRSHGHLDRLAEPDGRGPALLRRRWPARQPGSDPERVHQPRHGLDRLLAVELEPVELEHRERAAALELEPLELEHGSGRGARRRLRRHGRPVTVELEPLQLEPLELVDQLDQVALHGTGGNGAPGH